MLYFIKTTSYTGNMDRCRNSHEVGIFHTNKWRMMIMSRVQNKNSTSVNCKLKVGKGESGVGNPIFAKSGSRAGAYTRLENVIIGLNWALNTQGNQRQFESYDGVEAMSNMQPGSKYQKSYGRYPFSISLLVKDRKSISLKGGGQ